MAERKTFKRTTLARTKGVVRLPQSENAFFSQIKAHGCVKMFAAGTLRRQSRFPFELQQTMQYSYPALAHGRPLNKVMIILVGQTGAGKSTTINALFNDEICDTSCISSQTRTITEYGKELCVSDPNSLSVIGTLSFVDPPGSLDVDQTKEATNFAIISKFRHEKSDLRSRKSMLRESYVIREHVYPNIVLMVVNAGDNRMDGPDSNVQKTLRALEKYFLVDPLYPNLIVAVTHAMSIPQKIYKERTKLITHVIKEAVYNTFHLRKVQVVFVENKPDYYDLTKPEGYDFYRLPDGHLSHYNLIRAMEKQFDETGDDLGKLLCGWYFSDDCPEKLEKPTILSSVEDDSLSAEEMDEALQILSCIDMQLLEEEDVEPPTFNFQHLGHGYCPRTESLKSVTVYEGVNSCVTSVLNTLYRVPACFQINENHDEPNHFSQITFATKTSYERKRLNRYGLDSNVKISVSLDPTNRWVKNLPNQKFSTTRAIYEKRLLSACISDPESNVCKDLLEIINNLPASYDQASAECFQQFFNKYGSHFVRETWLGGYVVIDNRVKAATHTEIQGLDLHNKLRTVINGVITPQKGQNEYITSPEGSDGKHFQKCTLSLHGGDPPPITTLAEFTAVRYVDWIETVKRYPVELQHSFKLMPYYALVQDDDERKLALTQATLQYLEGTIPVPAASPTLLKHFVIYAEESDASGSSPEDNDEDSPPSLVTRNDVGNQMVTSAQAAARKKIPNCVIL